MKDLEGNELEVGKHYIVPSNSSSLCICVFSHETAGSYIFRPTVRPDNVLNKLFSWKRQITKYNSNQNIPVLSAPQSILTTLGIC